MLAAPFIKQPQTAANNVFRPTARTVRELVSALLVADFAAWFGWFILAASRVAVSRRVDAAIHGNAVVNVFGEFSRT